MAAKSNELKKVIAYTDGACSGNPGPGGYGVVLRFSPHEKELSEGFRLTTNSRMEIWAAIAALKALKSKSVVTIYSDSKYLVDSVSQGWVYRWKVNDWKKGQNEVPNADLWRQLLFFCEQHEVEFVWVKARGGNPGNERADQLSKRAVDQANLMIDTIYEQEQVDPPTLF